MSTHMSKGSHVQTHLGICCEAHENLVEADDDLPDASDSLFSVCPRNGCEAMLSAEQRLVFHDVHEDLVTAVRVHEPLKRDLSAHPLLLQWKSPTTGRAKFIAVAFNVRKPPWEMVLLQLEPSTGTDRCPFVLTLKQEAGEFCPSLLRSDMELCHELAREASDWGLHRLVAGDLSLTFGEFNIVAQEELSRESLRRSAEELKQILRAAKAAKIAAGMVPQRKRRARNTGKQQKKKARRPQADGEDWGSDISMSSGSHADEEAEGFGGAASSSAGHGPSASSAAEVGLGSSASPAPAAARRAKQARSMPWGPFQIAPIVPAGGQTGWGAICGQHCDRGNKLSCKKAMNRGSLTDAECILRLKRWLLAGCNDSSWPKHRQRSQHVELGGKGLQDFAEGMSEAEMDALVASWT